MTNAQLLRAMTLATAERIATRCASEPDGSNPLNDALDLLSDVQWHLGGLREEILRQTR